MPAFLTDAFVEALEVTAVVFVLMVVVELVNVRLQGKLTRLLLDRPRLSYVVTAVLAIIPGCEGEFLTVTLYSHGALTFGALLTCMVATTGDEGLTMLQMIPGQTAVLFAGLAVIGIVLGWAADKIWDRVGLPRRVCEEQPHHPGSEGLGHFFKEHVVHHVLGKHLPRIFLWTFGALIAANLAKPYLVPDESGVSGGLSGGALIVVAALVGLIPSSGPHLLFVALVANGSAPFSVLMANSLSQTGHGVLPLFHTSWRLVLLIKAITLVAGLTIGGLLMAAGV